MLARNGVKCLFLLFCVNSLETREIRFTIPIRFLRRQFCVFLVGVNFVSRRQCAPRGTANKCHMRADNARHKIYMRIVSVQIKGRLFAVLYHPIIHNSLPLSYCSCALKIGNDTATHRCDSIASFTSN